MPNPKDRWSRKLTRTITDRAGTKLHTFREARDYILDLPEGRQSYPSWQHAAHLLMESDDATAITDQIERALFLDAKLKLT